MENETEYNIGKEIKKCSVVGCERILCARGYCQAHWTRYNKTGKINIDKAFRITDNREMKICQNPLCNNIIYRYQHKSGRPYCSDDCVEETRHWRSVTLKIKKKGRD